MVGVEEVVVCKRCLEVRGDDRSRWSCDFSYKRAPESLILSDERRLSH